MRRTLGFLLTALAAVFFAATVPVSGFAQPLELSRAELAALENHQSSFRKLAQRILPVVVEINTVEVVRSRIPAFRSPFEFFFGPQAERREDPTRNEEREFRRSGLGSGVVVRRSADKYYILTNNHVVGDATEIAVKLHDGRSYDGRLVGTDPRMDVALVVIETDDSIPLANLGDSDKVQVGDWAIAVGNPLGFESTITVGVVSALGRRSVPGSGIPVFTDYIQTDAAINQGNSGGALVNIYGEVVGINTWIASQTGGSIGIGFAIPINNAKRAIDELILKGRVEYGWLGVNTGETSKELRDGMNLPMGGAFVFDVFKDSPAEESGLLPGDLIVRIDGNAVPDSTSLVRLVGTLTPGRSYQFQIVRYGERVNLSVKTAVRKNEAEIRQMDKKLWPGVAVLEINDRIRNELNLSGDIGRLVIGRVAAGSPASSAGLRAGDIIREMNGKRINNLVDFYRTLNDSGSREIMFRLHRGGSEFLVGLVK